MIQFSAGIWWYGLIGWLISLSLVFLSFRRMVNKMLNLDDDFPKTSIGAYGFFAILSWISFLFMCWGLLLFTLRVKPVRFFSLAKEAS